MAESTTPIKDESLVELINLALEPRSHPFQSFSIRFHKDGSHGMLVYSHDGILVCVSGQIYRSVREIKNSTMSADKQQEAIQQEKERSPDYVNPFNTDIMYAHFPRSEFDRMVDQAIPARIHEGYTIQHMILTAFVDGRGDITPDPTIYYYKEHDGLLQVRHPNLITNFAEIHEFCDKYKIQLRGENWSPFSD